MLGEFSAGSKRALQRARPKTGPGEGAGLARGLGRGELMSMRGSAARRPARRSPTRILRLTIPFAMRPPAEGIYRMISSQRTPEAYHRHAEWTDCELIWTASVAACLASWRQSNGIPANMRESLA